MANALNFELETWMTDLFPIIQNRKLTELFIPGSHDSPMTYECLTQPHWLFDNPTILGPDADDWLKGRFYTDLTLVRKVIRKWAVTQKLSLYDQLKAGIRYFDLRITKSNDVFRFTHSLLSHDDISTILGPVKDFMYAHPGEVLILHCQHFYEIVDGEYDRLFRVFQSLFGDMLTTRNKIDEAEFETYVKSGKRVLLIWQHDAAAWLSNHDLVYDEREALDSDWPQGIDAVEPLCKYLQDSQKNRPPIDPKLSVIQCILDSGKLGVVKLAVSSLLEYETDVNAYLGAELVPGLRRDKGFIYMLDNVGHPNSEIVAQIIRLHKSIPKVGQ